MKFPCTLKNALLIISDHFGLSFASKGLGYLATLLLLLSLLARYKLSCYQTTPLLTISELADTTLLKTTCHFLLLLVGFDTLTYRKELKLIPYTCGSSGQKTQDGPKKYERGAPRGAQPTRARLGAQARPGGLCPPRCLLHRLFAR